MIRGLPLFRRLSDLLVVEIVVHHRRVAEGRTVLIVVTDIQHAFHCRVCADLQIQRAPVIAAAFHIDFSVQTVEFGVVIVHPV